MPTRSTPWPPGTPCWTDHHVPDLETARSFYGAVLGWEIDDPDPGAGNFAAARLDGRPVAGFLVAVEGAQPGWHVFFASDDIDATAAAIARHGGTSLFGPHDVPVDRGRFQLARDPSGALFGVWQAGSLAGTGVYGEHGSLGWEDLRSTDPVAARAFYRAVFDHVVEPLADAGPDDAVFGPPAGLGRPVGGMGAVSTPGEPSRWVVSFVVDDVDAALTGAVARGGGVAEPGRDTPSGRVGAVVDPFGAGFLVVTPVSG